MTCQVSDIVTSAVLAGVDRVVDIGAWSSRHESVLSFSNTDGNTSIISYLILCKADMGTEKSIDI